MEELDQKQLSKRILVYLGITFVLTYAIEILLIAPLIGSADVNEAILAQSLISMVMFVPAIGVVITRLVTKEGFKGNLYFLINLKQNLRYYGLVWFGIGGLIILGAVCYFVLFPEHYDPEMGYAAAVLSAQTQTAISSREARDIMLIQIVTGLLLSPFVNILNCFGEEWGWRGYLLPRLMLKMPVVPAVLVNGAIWGLWHAPLVVLGHNYGEGYPGYPYVGILAMCFFCIVLGTILSYVTIKTRSCIPAILGHGMINGFATIGVYFTSLENPYNVFLGPAPTGVVGGIGFIGLAVFLLWKLWKEEKSEKHLLFKKSDVTIQQDE